MIDFNLFMGEGREGSGERMVFSSLPDILTSGSGFATGSSFQSFIVSPQGLLLIDVSHFPVSCLFIKSAPIIVYGFVLYTNLCFVFHCTKTAEGKSGVIVNILNTFFSEYV